MHRQLLLVQMRQVMVLVPVSGAQILSGHDVDSAEKLKVAWDWHFPQYAKKQIHLPRFFKAILGMTHLAPKAQGVSFQLALLYVR